MSPGGGRPRPLVIGVGNRDRGDDGVGPFVVDAVRAADGAEVETVVAEGDLCDLPLRWRSDQVVVAVDAMVSGRPPGTTDVIDGLTTVPTTGHPLSSHGVGLAQAIGLARALDRLPVALTLVLIEGSSFDHLDGLSDPVRTAGRDVADRMTAIIAASQEQHR